MAGMLAKIEPVVDPSPATRKRSMLKGIIAVGVIGLLALAFMVVMWRPAGESAPQKEVTETPIITDASG